MSNELKPTVEEILAEDDRKRDLRLAVLALAIESVKETASANFVLGKAQHFLNFINGQDAF